MSTATPPEVPSSAFHTERGRPIRVPAFIGAPSRDDDRLPARCSQSVAAKTAEPRDGTLHDLQTPDGAHVHLDPGVIPLELSTASLMLARHVPPVDQ